MPLEIERRCPALKNSRWIDSEQQCAGTPGTSPSDRSRRSQFPKPFLMQINKLRLNLKTLGGGVLSVSKHGGERNKCLETFCEL